jgi:hypothetical protein
VSHLLDTNVLLEWTRPRPDPAVIRFLTETSEDLLYLSVVSIAEIRRGIERLPSGKRRQDLDAWLDGALLPRFDGRILGIGPRVADCWGRMMAHAERNGRTPAVQDTWIAAIAAVNEMAVVTRNTADFAPFQIGLVNPWTPA